MPIYSFLEPMDIALDGKNGLYRCDSAKTEKGHLSGIMQLGLNETMCIFIRGLRGDLIQIEEEEAR